MPASAAVPYLACGIPALAHICVRDATGVCTLAVAAWHVRGRYMWGVATRLCPALLVPWPPRWGTGRLGESFAPIVLIYFLNNIIIAIHNIYYYYPGLGFAPLGLLACMCRCLGLHSGKAICMSVVQLNSCGNLAAP
jgi:hypothetical protein